MAKRISRERPDRAFPQAGVGRLRWTDWAVLGALLLFNLLWFYFLRRSGIIMGDDLYAVAANRAIDGDPFLLIAYRGGNKYRPVTSALWYIAYRLCGTDYTLYLLVNICANWLVTASVYYVAGRLVKNRLLALFAAVLYVVAPFSWYGVSQLMGLMEIGCLFFMVWAFCFALRYYRTGRSKWLLLSVFFGLLTVFTHERFIVMAPLYIILVLCRAKEPLPKKAALCLVGVSPFAFNYALKTYAFTSNFFEGTGGVGMRFDFSSILSFFGSGLLTMLGINTGPVYLNGYTFDKYSPFLQKIAVGATAFAVACLIAYILRRIVFAESPGARLREIRASLIAVCAIGALLLSGCTTIRLEMRWIYAPYVAYILYYSYILSRLMKRRVARVSLSALVVCVAALTVFLGAQYRARLDDIFFMRAFRIGNSVYEATLGEYGASLADGKVYFIDSRELEWAVGSGDTSLYAVYGADDLDFRYISSVREVENAGENDRLFFLNTNLTVSEDRVSLRYPLIGVPENYDALPDTPAATPSGKGVVFMGANSFTVVSHYAGVVSFENAAAGEALLYFRADMPFPNGDGALVTVTMWMDGGQADVIEFPILPSDDIREFLLPLKAGLPEDARFSFAVSSPGGDDVADWVTFFDAKLLAPGNQ